MAFVGVVNELVEMKIDNPTGIEGPSMKADHAEGSANNAAALEVCLR